MEKDLWPSATHLRGDQMPPEDSNVVFARIWQTEDLAKDGSYPFLPWLWAPPNLCASVIILNQKNNNLERMWCRECYAWAIQYYFNQNVLICHCCGRLN